LVESDVNKRLIARLPVLKTAKVHTANSVYDCLVVDLSVTGLRLSTEVPVAFPPDVRIELRSGAIWAAELRWQRGREAGFEFLLFDGLNDETSQRAAEMFDAFRNCGVAEVLSRLEEKDYFGSPDLRSAAETFARAHEAAAQAFHQVLKKS
jgi:hypothetical protein